MFAALGAAAVVACLLPAAAGAHAFLIRSQPEPGSRLASAPTSMTLRFSEPFAKGTQRLTLQRVSGRLVALPLSRTAGAVIYQPLPSNLRGVFIVSWRLVSDDGHTTSGQFAFAVGSTAAFPTVQSSIAGTSWSDVPGSWLLFVGLALALGGLLSEWFVWRARPGRVVAAPVLPGVTIAALGALLELVALAGGERGGGLSKGLSAGAITSALGTRPGALSLGMLTALVIAGALGSVRRVRVTAVAPLLAVVFLSADRGHSGTSGTEWAVAADAVHLAAVAAWLGALVHLVRVTATAGERAPTFLDGARRYSRCALPTVLVMLVAGVLTAVPEFGSAGAVFSSGYGQTLLIKSGVTALALLLALTARLRALASNPAPRLSLLQRLTAAEASAVLGVLVVAAILVNAVPPRAGAQAQAPPTLLAPPPVAGPTVRLADLAGQLIVAVSAGSTEQQFTVEAPAYQPPGGVALTVTERQPGGAPRPLRARACGSDCFSTRSPLRRGVTLFTARAHSSRWPGGAVTFAVPWPLEPQQPAVLTRIAAAMRAVPSMAVTGELTLGGSTTQSVKTYSQSGRRFLQGDVFGAGGAIDVRLLGTEAGLTEYAFVYRPAEGSSIWYRIWIDRHYRLQRELLVGEEGRIVNTFRYPAGT